MKLGLDSSLIYNDLAISTLAFLHFFSLHAPHARMHIHIRARVYVCVCVHEEAEAILGIGPHLSPCLRQDLFVLRGFLH